MAKRRRKKRKKKSAKKCPIRAGYDRHHIFYQGRHYNCAELLQLRNHPYCVVPIPRDTLHREIHEFVGDIPKPSKINAKETLFQIEALEKAGSISLEDSLEKRLDLLAFFFDCVEQPTADALRKQLKIVCKFNQEPP